MLCVIAVSWEYSSRCGLLPSCLFAMHFTSCDEAKPSKMSFINSPSPNRKAHPILVFAEEAPRPNCEEPRDCAENPIAMSSSSNSIHLRDPLRCGEAGSLNRDRAKSWGHVRAASPLSMGIEDTPHAARHPSTSTTFDSSVSSLLLL